MSTFFFLLNDLIATINVKSKARFLSLLFVIFACLALFSGFFLLGGVGEEEIRPALAPNELHVHLSPRLASATIDEMHRQIRERDAVRQITFRFPQELGLDQVEGLFLIRAVSTRAAAELAAELSIAPGVVRVDSSPIMQKQAISLATPIKIGLLIGFALSIVASLIMARSAFAKLFNDFAEEIRMMRLAGTTERVIQPPIIAVGLLCGAIAGLLLIVVIYLLHFLSTIHPATILYIAPGLAEPTRVLIVSLAGFLLGLALGGLLGMMGASLTGSKDFRAYS